MKNSSFSYLPLIVILLLSSPLDHRTVIGHSIQEPYAAPGLNKDSWTEHEVHFAQSDVTNYFRRLIRMTLPGPLLPGRGSNSSLGPENNQSRSLSAYFRGLRSLWFWTMVMAIGVVLTLIFVCLQVRIQRFGNMINILYNMRKDWTEGRMLEWRKKTCENYKKDSTRIGNAESSVLNFFEEIGLLWSKQVVSIEIVWESYSYFIEHYWVMLEPNIEAFRTETGDRTWFDNFERLRNALLRYGQKKGVAARELGESKIGQFIRGELED